MQKMHQIPPDKWSVVRVQGAGIRVRGGKKKTCTSGHYPPAPDLREKRPPKCNIYIPFDPI